MMYWYGTSSLFSSWWSAQCSSMIINLFITTVNSDHLTQLITRSKVIANFSISLLDLSSYTMISCLPAVRLFLFFSWKNCDDEVCCFCLAQSEAKGSPFRGSCLSYMRDRVASFPFLEKKLKIHGGDNSVNQLRWAEGVKKSRLISLIYYGKLKTKQLNNVIARAKFIFSLPSYSV